MAKALGVLEAGFVKNMKNDTIALQQHFFQLITPRTMKVL